jgi:hypothetical protein
MRYDIPGVFSLERITNMIPKKYTVWFYTAKSGNITQAPNTGLLTKREANALARKLRNENSRLFQVAVYSGNKMKSCYGLSENLKPLVTI